MAVGECSPSVEHDLVVMHEHLSTAKPVDVAEVLTR